MIVTTRDFKTQGRKFYYHCANHHMRGPRVCANRLEGPWRLQTARF
jgi:hypothetical protein